ncbi:MAG: Trm112 family protein [Pseudomonadota bacterium]
MTDAQSPGPDEQQRPASPVDPKLLDILVCPLTKSTLRYDRQRQELISDQAGLAYPIRDGIPIMLVDEARTLGEDEAIPDQVKARGR